MMTAKKICDGMPMAMPTAFDCATGFRGKALLQGDDSIILIKPSGEVKVSSDSFALHRIVRDHREFYQKLSLEHDDFEIQGVWADGSFNVTHVNLSRKFVVMCPDVLTDMLLINNVMPEGLVVAPWATRILPFNIIKEHRDLIVFPENNNKEFRAITMYRAEGNMFVTGEVDD